MALDGATAARRDLLGRLHDVLKAVRLFKSRQPLHPLLPSGTLGVLTAIDSVPASVGCHGKDLAALCALDPSTISRAVAALVRADLVIRTADPHDGRASVLTLTPQGSTALAEVSRGYEDALADALRDWTVQDLQLLTALLQRFADDLMSRFDTHHTLEAAR